MPDLSELLDAIDTGSRSAAAEFDTVVHSELKEIALACLRGRGPDSSLSTTALVHEVWIKLADQTKVTPADRLRFHGLAARMMRDLLVDHARRRGALKRGGGRSDRTLDEAVARATGIDFDIADLHEALNELAVLDRQQSRIVELRFFGGLDNRQIAQLIGTSLSTVEREWRAARAWLGVQLGGSGS